MAEQTICKMESHMQGKALDSMNDKMIRARQVFGALTSPLAGGIQLDMARTSNDPFALV